MFKQIDYDNWDRKEIYVKFYGYLYCLTVQMDITEFVCKIKKKGFKFYPSICWCITKATNSDIDYRYSRVNGKVGYWDKLNAHYSLMRKNTSLFTHNVTEFTEDFETFHENFLVDKENAENCNGLYYYTEPQPDTVHISTMPGTAYTALSYSKPTTYTNYGAKDTAFIPFVTVGKYYESEGRIKVPVTVEFHHAVNDGYHADKFFKLLEETCRNF